MAAQLPIPTVTMLALLSSLGMLLCSNRWSTCELQGATPMSHESKGSSGPGCKPGQSEISPSFDQQKLEEALSSQREKRGRSA